MRIEWLLLCVLAGGLEAAEPLAARIRHTDPAQYRHAKSVHGGAPGGLSYMGLLDRLDLNTNLIFVHRGVIPPKGGIGHHFHNQMEEMFVIFDNEAEFTINGRASRMQGPAGAPCRMGSSHAIYNPTDKPTEWMNIAVGTVKGQYDAFDLGDDRVGAAKDATPVFVSMRLDRKQLRPVEGMLGGKGTAQYRRVLPHTVFYTNWAFIDHVVLANGASLGRHRHEGVEEVFYVMNGEGQVHVEKESAPVRKGDAVPVFLNEAHSFTSAAGGELELMIVGVSRQKGNLDTVEVR